MIRLLADQNIHDSIVDGLLLRQPELDIVLAREVGLANSEDPELLAWAADHDRIILTYDRNTMPKFVYERMAQGGKVSGVFILNRRLSIGAAIREVLLIVEYSTPDEWRDAVTFVPI